MEKRKKNAKIIIVKKGNYRIRKSSLYCCLNSPTVRD